MKAIRSFVLGAAILAGCAQVPTVRPNTVVVNGQSFALEAGDLPINQMPAATFTVPSFATIAPHPVTTGNQARLYVFPTETLPALKQLIAGARRSLYFETFNFGNDSMGKQIYPLLIEKAKAGVEVKVIADYVGSRFIKGHGEMVSALRKGGVDIRIYKPRTMIKDDQRRGINITHRKVYLADGERGLIGGVNLMAPFDYDVQDVLVEWQGPVVQQLYSEYGYDWKAAGGGALAQAYVPPAVPGTVTGRVVVTSPPQGRYEARDTIYAGIAAARGEIRIENQYLWDKRLVDGLHAALKRGVKLRVIVPGDEDHGIFRFIHAEELKLLTDAGAQARLYTGIDPDAHLHVKYFGVDDRWVAIGSANGDTRALMDNQELDTVIENPGLAREFRERLFEKDWAQFTKPFVYKPGAIDTKPFQSLLDIIEYYL